jgi:hypothetical protein
MKPVGDPAPGLRNTPGRDASLVYRHSQVLEIVFKVQHRGWNLTPDHIGVAFFSIENTVVPSLTAFEFWAVIGELKHVEVGGQGCLPGGAGAACGMPAALPAAGKRLVSSLGAAIFDLHVLSPKAPSFLGSILAITRSLLVATSSLTYQSDRP